MKYVAVKHKPEDAIAYWFLVPEGLKSEVCLGAEVLCLTRYGKASGKIRGIVEFEDEGTPEKDVSSPIADLPDLSMLKPILAVRKDFPIQEIKIPEEFSASRPALKKLFKRIKEFYRTGGFETSVIVSADGTLKDGYTAYIAARIYGLETLRGLCVAD